MWSRFQDNVIFGCWTMVICVTNDYTKIGTLKTSEVRKLKDQFLRVMIIQ